MTERLINLVLLTVALVAVAVVLAAGQLLVEWLASEGLEGPIWRVAIALVLGAIGGAGALAGLLRRLPEEK